MADSLETGRFATCVTLPNLVVLSQTVQASRLSRSFKVIGTVMDRWAIYDFLLVDHSNYGHISYRFRDKRRLRSKIANFSYPCVFNVPAEGVPLEFCNSGGLIKTRMIAQPEGGKTFYDTCNCFDTISSSDRRIKLV